MPFVPDPLSMLRLCLVNSIRNNIVDNVTLADYLLFCLNLNSQQYCQRYECIPTNNVTALIDHIGRYTGKMQKGGIVDEEATALHFINDFRAGKLGHFVLDPMDDTAISKRLREETMAIARRGEKLLKTAKLR